MKKRARTAISNEDFNEGLEFCLGFIEKTLADEKTESLTPLVLTLEVSEAGKIGVSIHVFEEFGGEKGRRMLQALGRYKAQQMAMVMAAFVLAEAWMTVSPKPLNQRPMPSDDPTRIEIITVAGMALDGRVNMAHIEISRDADNKIVPGKKSVRFYGSKESRGVGNYLCSRFFEGYKEGIKEFMDANNARMN